MIACASDSGYALPLAVMLRSLIANLGPRSQVEVYCVDDGISSADKAKVLASVTDRLTLHWLEPSRSALSGLPTWGRMPRTTYQKLTLGEWLPEHAEKVIWLDCDLLLLDDIMPLWDADLGKWHVLAVRISVFRCSLRGSAWPPIVNSAWLLRLSISTPESC